jgi:predicted GNAT family acetyltransferase
MLKKETWSQMQHAVTIEREELNGAHEFVLRIDGKRLGFLEYTRPDVGVMRIEYVEVSPELRGTGLGKQLVEKAVAFAKDTQLKVVPICSYARAVIHRDPALAASL